MSSLKDLASLIMIPSLVKDGRLDTVKPLGNEIIHPDATGNNDGTDGSTPSEGNFTFSRGSNLAATRVDVNGLIEKGRENVLTYSRTFASNWGTLNTTLTSGQAGYDGSNNAVKVTAVANGPINFQQGISFANVNTFSVYLKAGNVDYAKIFMVHNGANRTAVLDLINGTIEEDNNADIPATITPISNGWYRCSISANSTNGSVVRVRSQRIEGDDNVLAGDYIFVQDAQLEAGLVATDYIETGASTAQAGILEDMPRLDYSGGASCPALLLEPQRTNLLPQSEYFGASWSASNITITSNATTSPEGVDNAALLENTSASNYLVYGSSVSASTTYQFSFYAKNIDATNADVIFYDATNAVVVSTIAYEGDLTNEWKRLDFSVTTPAGCTTLNVNIVNGLSGSMYVYGASLEAGSYPTSYIPTYGSAVTRSDDDCRANGIEDYIGQSEGTIFVDVDVKQEVNTESYFIRVDASNFSDTIYIVRNTDKSVSGVLRSNNSTIFNQWLLNQSGRIKAALAYKSGNFAFYINGTEVATSSATYSSSFVYNDITLGEYKGSTAQMSGLIKQALVFKTRLTNAELAALTTI